MKKEGKMSKSLKLVTVFYIIFCLLLTSCCSTTEVIPTDTLQPESTISATQTPSPTPTSTPTPTATPTPVSVENAIRSGSLTEIETVGKGYIRNNAYSPDGMYLALVVDRGLYAYSTDTMEELLFYPLEPGTTIESVTFSNDGKLLFAGDSNSTVTIWSTQTWEVTQTMALRNGPIVWIDISPDGSKMVTVGGTYQSKYTLSLWDLTDGSLLNSYFRDNFGGRVDFSADGSRIFYAESRDVTVWYVKDLQLYDRIEGVGGYKAMLPDRDVFSNGYTIYDFENNKSYHPDFPLDDFDYMEKVIFLDEGRLLIKTDNSNRYFLYTMKSRTVAQVYPNSLTNLSPKYPEIGIFVNKAELEDLGFVSNSYILGVTDNGKYLLMSDGVMDIETKKVTEFTLYDLWNGYTYQKLEDGNLAVVKKDSRYAKNGNLSITTYSQEDLSVISEQQLEYDLEERIELAILSPDGKILAAGLGNGTLVLWNISTKEVVAKVKYAHSSGSEFGEKYSFSRIGFSPDSSQVITVGTVDHIKNIWSSADLSKVTTMNKLGEQSPDGHYFAYKYSDSAVLVNDTTGTNQPILIDNKSIKININRFTNDSKLLILSDEWGLQFWSLEDQSLVLKIPRYTSAYFSPDGSRLYTQSNDTVIGIWAGQ
jgi:WD40 repeat protein